MTRWSYARGLVHYPRAQSPWRPYNSQHNSTWHPQCAPHVFGGSTTHTAPPYLACDCMAVLAAALVGSHALDSALVVDGCNSHLANSLGASVYSQQGYVSY